MRPLSFDSQALRKHLLRHKIATLPELKDALGTTTDLTVFRKLKLLDYLSSYTHRGRYYALREVARFDDAGLWSHEAVWFSRYGTLVATVESFVNQSPSGWFADELTDILHAEVQEPLHDLVRAERLLDKAAAHTHKKYEAQYANQIWQSDMLFGPWVRRPGGGKMQVFLQATLDDASRLIPHAQFYPNQGLDSFLDCLRQSIAARGLPLRLYMDNAKIYRSPQLARIAASLGILIVHTPPYQPEGRGKIERFFRSVREQFLASLDGRTLLAVEQLNERLWHWLETVYHLREHSSLQTTPLLRWQRDIEQIRQLPPATDMCRLFFYRADRLVRRDSTFLLCSRFFEAPPHLSGQRIEVRFDPLDLAHVEIYHAGKLEGAARLVDAVVNGRTGR